MRAVFCSGGPSDAPAHKRVVGGGVREWKLVSIDEVVDPFWAKNGVLFLQPVASFSKSSFPTLIQQNRSR